jgi:Mg2+ and Co2+ transporter CorA
MNIAQDTGALHTQQAEPLCVLATSTGTELATTAATKLGLDLPSEQGKPRRPSVAATTGQTDLVLFVLDDDRQLRPVQVFTARGGLLVVAAEPVLTSLRSQIHGDHDDVDQAVVTVLLCLARHSQETLDGLVDDTHQLETRARGYTSAPQRRTMGRLRDQLFQLGEVESAQHDLLGPDEELAQSLGTDQQRLLKRAATAFADTRSMAMQLYARLGDVLDQQGTIVSERLTLVATIFLPLTLVTGFFGMSFNWMLQRIGSLPAFIGFGIVIPVVLTVVTLVMIRRLTHSS